MDSNMFNTADTNYMEIDPKGDMGVAANKGITDVVAKNKTRTRWVIICFVLIYRDLINDQ